MPFTAYQQLAKEEQGDDHSVSSVQGQSYITSRFLPFNIGFFCLSLAISLWSVRHVYYLSHNVNNSLLKATSTYSPVFDHLDMPLRTIKSNNSFWPQNPPSIFQLPPSPEVDAAWERISDTHALVIRREELIRMGRDPAEQWPWPKEYGYGEDAYMGLLDVFHQLHCLNELRMAAYPDYYNKAADEHGQNAHKAAGKVHFTRGGHNLHCQYALLQFILCHADVSVITFNYVEGIRGPMADFSINHQCRDFDSLLQWKLDHQVNVTNEEWQLINRVPEGTRQLRGEGRAWPFGQETES